MEGEQIFTLDEARAMLPWLRETCEQAEQQIEAIRRSVDDRDEALAAIRQIIQYWADTIRKLGPVPKQPFTVDFNSGNDYFCWEYPEQNIYFRHGYNAGYAGRQPIEE